MSLMGKPAKSASGSAQDWAKPYATEGAQDVLNVYNANQPGLQATQGQINNTLGQLGTAGQGLASQTAAYGATGGKANSFEGDVVGGKYMSGNPYIKNILGQLDESIMNGVNSNFENAGRYGSGAYVGEMGKQLGNANMQVLYGNYSDEMNRRMQAAQQAQQALAQSQQAQNSNFTQQLAGQQLAAQAPYTGINAMGNSLGALFNGGTQTGAKPGLIDYLMQASSNAASAAAASSDRRMKKNIVKTGEYPDGLGIYEWVYKSDPSNTRCRGVMADEVERLRPWAYIADFKDGMAGVNYGALNR